MSGLFYPASEYFKPAVTMVDPKAGLASGMRLCYVFNGYDSREVIRNDRPIYSGFDTSWSGSGGVRPSHVNNSDKFDDNNYSNTPDNTCPHGQSIYLGNINAAYYMTFPNIELKRFIEWNKPWSWWWKGRLHPAVYGPFWTWGHVAEQSYRGLNCSHQAAGPGFYLDVISTWNTSAKRFRPTTFTIQPFDTITLGFSYDGKPTGASGVSECQILINGRRHTPITAPDTPGTISSTLINDSPLTIFGYGNPTGAGIANTYCLAFWDRVLSESEFRQLAAIGLPLV